MKAVIPVAGIGSRLRPHTHTQPTTLVPVAGKPILGHIIDHLIGGNIQEFVFILGYLGDKIESYIQENYPNIETNFVIQEPREGLAHAIWTARQYLDNEDEIFIVLGDTIAHVDLELLKKSPYSVLCVQKVSNPMLFGIAEINKDTNFVKKLIEKPKIPKSNLALVGLYKITNVNVLLQSIEEMISNKVKTNNEFQLTDALMKMIEKGEKMTTLLVDNWFDCGRRSALLQANAILLERKVQKYPKKYEFPETIIINPVRIGENCEISDAIIGPNVAIGNNAKIHRSIIQDTIIGSFSELKDVILHNSIIGNDSLLKGVVHKLSIGDSTEIDLG